MMIERHTDNCVDEHKHIWDEEGRMTASSDNGLATPVFGYVRHRSIELDSLPSLARKVFTNYWYDADGERTVKSSGSGDHVFVNGTAEAGLTETQKFTLYVGPWLVANEGGRYTKHIYAGAERIASKTGTLGYFSMDPRSEKFAGNKTPGVTVDYGRKYNARTAEIAAAYSELDVPYAGTQNNDFKNGPNFGSLPTVGTPDYSDPASDPISPYVAAEVDESPEGEESSAANTASGSVTVDSESDYDSEAVGGTNGDGINADVTSNAPTGPARSFGDTEAYEPRQYYYHPDHLGSTTYVTDVSGAIVQHIEYVPFGEVFIEERHGDWNAPYLFNAKELDEETGLYYYGARYYDPRLSLWLSPDPMAENQPEYNPYCFSNNNPIIYVDPDGHLAILYLQYRITASLLERTRSRYLKTTGYVMKHPYIAYKVGKVKDGATNISTIASNFEINIAYAANLKRDEDGTPGNAIRHTLWQAIITRDYGTDEARHIGNVHEDNHDLDLNQRIFNDMKPADSTVDLLNNIIGRELGRKNPNATNVELAKKVMEEFLKNGLWTVENINGEYRIQKTRITQEEYESAIKEINKKNETGKNN